MKKIFNLFLIDVKHALKTPMVLIVILGLCILPSFYAWFNLKSSWDPYSNTKGIKVAVVNFDEGATVKGKNINVGQSLVKELKTNDQFGWVFVDSLEDAEQGVKLGDYYALIHIPRHFSADMTSIFNKKPKRAHIDYQVNQKVNAIAPKMTNAGATAITKSLNDKFVEAATKAFLKESNDLGANLEGKLPLYHKIENAVFEAEAAIPDMEKFSAAVQKIDEHQGDINQYANEFYALESYKDEINEGAAKLVRANQHASEINEAGQMIIGLNSRTNEIEAALNKAQQLEEKFPEINAAVDKGIQATEKANQVLSVSQSKMPAVHERLNQAQSKTQRADKKVESVEEAIPKSEIPQTELPAAEKAIISENPAIDEEKVSLEERVTTESITAENPVTEAVVQLKAVTQQQPEVTKTDLVPAKEALSEALNALTDLVKENGQGQYDILEALKTDKPSGDNMEIIAQNMNQTVQLQNQVLEVLKSSDIDTMTIQNALQNSNDTLSVVAGQLTQGHIDITAIQSAQNALRQLMDMDMQSILLKGLNTIDGNLDDLSAKLAEAQSFASSVDDIIARAQTVTISAHERLITINQSLPAIENRFKQINGTVQSNFPAFKSRVNEASLFVQNDLPGALNDLNRISQFAENDLPDVMSKYDETADLLKNKLPGAENGIHQLAEFARNDLPGIETDIRKAADKFRELDNKDVMNKLIKLLRNDLQDEANYFSDPIQLDEKAMFPIPNYGSASAPFYTALALWVGALLSSNLLTTELKDLKLKGTYSLRELYAGRLLLFLSIGIIQSIIVMLGNFFILDAYAKHPVYNILFGVGVAIVFTTIVYTMVSLLGNVGKALAIILMVLQISGGGGTFPVQVTPQFFQVIHPFLPFTYAVDLLREAVGGIVPELVVKNISRLAFVFMLVLSIGYGLKPKFEPIKLRMIKTSKESTIVE